jgi:hypothetical protein
VTEESESSDTDRSYDSDMSSDLRKSFVSKAGRAKGRIQERTDSIKDKTE